MSSGKPVLAGVAAIGFLAGLHCGPASAASLAANGPMQAGAMPASGVERVLHGHSRRSASYYCYPRNYWWFYRPYVTAQEGNARCMPYFHYPPSGRGRPGSGVK